MQFRNTAGKPRQQATAPLAALFVLDDNDPVSDRSMPVRFRSALLASAVTLPACALAQPITGPYVDLGGGGNFLQNQKETPFENFGSSARTFTFDQGAAAQAGAGYGFGNGFRIELNGDYTYNHVHGVKYSVPLRAGGSEDQYGGFLDGIYDFSLGLPVTPYLGAGAGAQAVELYHINSNYYQTVVHPPLDQTKTKFAYQAIAGFSVPLFLPGLSLTAEYRFIGVINPEPYLRNDRTEVQANGLIIQYRDTFHNIFSHQALLGLRYALFQPPPPAPPSPAAAAAPAPAPEPSRTYLVFFDWDRADLTGRARQIVAEAAQASTHVQTTRIEVNGYTDLSGTAAYNQRLSVRRAQSVEAELVRDGVARNEITIHGFGESNPLVQTAAGVREPQNRRVEIVLR